MKTNIKQHLICKGTKKELEELIKWASSEIDEYKKFLSEAKNRLQNIDKKGVKKRK